MGGCASAPKDLKGDAGSAPVPEPSKEETVEVELEGVEKVAEENVEKSEEDKKSLGSLLDEVVSKHTPYDKFLILYVIFVISHFNTFAG
jgi:hypothetical protein